MRRGTDSDINTLEEDTFLGFDLSSDFCDEHEWGLKFKEDFGNWLNPHNQKSTVEDLELRIDGKGPIIKKGKE